MTREVHVCMCNKVIYTVSQKRSVFPGSVEADGVGT